MQVVIDANIFISASLWGGKPRKIIDRFAGGADTLFISDDILVEVADVLGRPKFGLTNEGVEQRMAELERLGKKVVISTKHRAPGVSRDPKDTRYIECALAANADYIISGDIHLLEIKEYRGVKIVTAKEYLEIVNA